MISVIPSHYVAGGFLEPFTRSDRELVGDNGWYFTHTSPSTGIYTITSNRFRTVAATSGFPGSSGTIGVPIAHDITPSAADVEDVTFEIITGAITANNGWVYMVMGATTTGSPPTINSGVLLRWLMSGANNILIQKIIAANNTTDHSPGTFPTCPANATTTVRVQLTRSTGVVKVWVNGTLQYTSAAGDFSSLTGSTIAYQLSNAYSTAPIEIDTVSVA